MDQVSKLTPFGLTPGWLDMMDHAVCTGHTWAGAEGVERMRAMAARPMAGEMEQMPLRRIRVCTAALPATMPTPRQAPHWML